VDDQLPRASARGIKSAKGLGFSPTVQS
jgi:hypothetical protein